nr:glycerophosphoryl diester phosphodiesterase membrane domain-containing protein [Clostridium polynesiense]
MKKTLISNIEVIKETVNDFKNTLMKYLFFEVSYKLLTSSVLIPFLIFTFRRFINLYGISGLTNSQILNFALSLKGFLVIGIVSLMALIIIFVEISVLVIISQKSYFNKSISVSDALRTSFRRIPYIIGAGTIPVILFLLILIPFGGLGLGASFFESVPLPKFIEGEIYNSIKYTMLYICSAVFLAFILTKFVFIFHCIIIERLSITKAIKRSSEIAKGMRRKIIAITLGWNLFLAAVMFLLLAIAAGVMLLISFLFKLNMSITNIELNLVNFGGVVLFIFSFLAAPSNISIITKVYYFQRNKIDGIVQDELNTEKKKKKIDTIESRVYNYLKGHRNILVLFMAAVVVLTTALGSYFAEEVYFNIKKVKLISHRGITEREPENSLSAIKASIEHNLNYAEIDVQMTKDGVVVLMHDETLKRLAGINKKVRDINYNELKNIDIGMSYPAEF